MFQCSTNMRLFHIPDENVTQENLRNFITCLRNSMWQRMQYPVFLLQKLYFTTLGKFHRLSCRPPRVFLESGWVPGVHSVIAANITKRILVPSRYTGGAALKKDWNDWESPGMRSNAIRKSARSRHALRLLAHEFSTPEFFFCLG